MKLTTAPIDFDQAAAFVREHHRHHTPPVGQVVERFPAQGIDVPNSNGPSPEGFVR